MKSIKKKKEKLRGKKLIENILIDENHRNLLDYYSVYIDGHGYVMCSKMIKGVIYRHKLHHLVIGKAEKGLCVDHKNGNKLDNREENLHKVSYSYNNTNKKKRKDSSQKYKGIQLLPSGRYSVKITGGKRIGTFSNAELAYNHYKNYLLNKFKEKIYAIEN